jgi:hypothetical protein
MEVIVSLAATLRAAITRLFCFVQLPACASANAASHRPGARFR